MERATLVMIGNDRDLDLLVIGEINPDVVVADADAVPVFGQVERTVRSIDLTIGSSSAIMACGAARLGLRTAFFGVVGSDPFGRFMLDALAAQGVDTSACQIDPSRPTGASVILTSGSDRAILTSVGTIDALNVDALPPELLGRARHVHLGSYFLQRTSRSRLPVLFQSAQEAGLTTSFDCNWDPDERWDGGIDSLLPVTDLFFPNATEATRLARMTDVEDAARDLMRRGSTARSGGRNDLTVVVKCGADGALAVRGTELVKVSALPVQPIDTTGAGDSFDAGFLCGWLAARSLTEAMELGVACGSLSTLQVGGTAGQPTLEQANAAIAQWRGSGPTA